MKLSETFLSGVYIVESNPLADQRGYFARTYCKNDFKSIGFQEEFVQFNHSFNLLKGTVRGMHFQRPPHAETKYVRCVHGSIFDVVVDIRKDSPTYLQHFCIELSFSNMLGLIIPEGCAHGFQVLEDNTLVIYHHTEYYQSGAEKGLKYDDPLLGIVWPLAITNISDRDKNFSIINQFFQPIQL